MRKAHAKPHHGGGLCTQRPPTMVATTSASRSSHGSRSSTTRSATWPGISVPRRRSSRASQAGATHVAWNAWSTVSALLRMPGGPLVDRAPHAGPDARERVELLDRRVAAVAEHGARVEQRPERVGAVGLAGPELIGDVAIRRRVRELHGAGDAELGEAGEILGGEQLRVLDPLPQPLRLPEVPRLLECVQRLAVGAVADRVHRDREARRGAAPHDLGQLLAARDLHAAAVEHPRRLRAERAVHEHLQVAELHERAAEARAQPRSRARARACRAGSTARRAATAGRAPRAAARGAVRRASRPCRAPR